MADSEPQKFEVYQENWKALLVFLSMATQWRWTGGMTSRREGLEYGAFPIAFEAVGIKKKNRRDIIVDVQSMERASLAVWNNPNKVSE
nr:DUF1799 domain-containing protein [Rugamonas sp.]